MTTTKKIMQKELRSICHYLSFLCARIFMCVLLFLFGYTLRPSSYYMIFSIIMFPIMWHIMLTSSHGKPNSRQNARTGRGSMDSLSDKKREGGSDVLLSSLKSRYHYTPQKLKAEISGFLCICLLLLFWQSVKNLNAPAVLTPLDRLPLYTIASGLFVRICAFYIIKSILHNRLMNNRL